MEKAFQNHYKEYLDGLKDSGYGAIKVITPADISGPATVPALQAFVEKELLPKIYLLIPLVLLVWLVSTNTKTLAYSAAIALIVSILVAIPCKNKIGKNTNGFVTISANISIILITSSLHLLCIV